MIVLCCHQFDHMNRKNKRMSSISSNDEHVLLLSQIKGAFECVICLDVPSDVPIPQCENGHILCRACRDKVLDCPVCKVKLGKSRCLAAEKILELCPRPCEFEASGCRIKLIPSKLPDHIKICKFAPIQCVYPNCEVTSPLNLLSQHLDIVHMMKTIDNGILTYPNPKNNHNFEGKFKPAKIVFDGFEFITSVLKRSSLARRWIMWLYILGTPDESKKYIYTAKVKGKEFNEEFSYSGQTISVQLKDEEIIKSGRYLVFDDVVEKRLCSNDKIDIEYSIQCNVLK